MSAKHKVHIFSLIVLLLATVNSCSKRNENIDGKIHESALAIQAGRINDALSILNELGSAHPENLEIVKLTAIANQRIGNYADAAFYFDIAASMNSGDPRLFKHAAESYVQASDYLSARGSYFNYLKNFTEDAVVWMDFADVLSQRDEGKKALDAYLKGIELLKIEPTSDQYTKLAQLFLKVENFAQAEFRFKQALQDRSAYSLPSLLGLLEVQQRTKNYKEAKGTIARLEQEYPGALATTPLASVKNEIRSWESEKARQPVVKAVVPAPELIAVQPLKIPSIIDREPVIEAEIEPEAEVAQSEEQPVIDPTETTEPQTKITLTLPTIEGSRPGEASGLGLSNAAAPLVQDGNLIVENQISNKPEVEIEDNNPTGLLANANENELASSELIENQEEQLPDQVIPEKPKSKIEIDELKFIEEADKKLLGSDYTGAISSYWKALGLNSQNASTWYSLSQAYTLSREMDNAEMTIMEAVRNDEENLLYRIEYLKLVKKIRPAEKYLDELLKGKEDFPDDPTIILSLASAFTTIRNKPHVTILLYEEFLKKHPEHPLVPRVKTRLEKLVSGT